MRGKVIICGLVLLGLLGVADWIGGDRSSLPWGLIIGLPLVGVVAAYLIYLAVLKVSGNAANDAHDKRVGARMPKIIAAVIGAVILAATIPHYVPILWDRARAQAGETAGGLVESFDATSTGAEAVLPPAWVVIAVPVLTAGAVWFIRRGKDAEAKTVRSVTVALVALGTVIASAATGVLA
jgi:cytochrome bd-type quinol oxidase subunit 2